ncbi:Cytochrome P450 2H2 [Chelonia mydas]|uniref:unspecific monooxygenase n=1 Tax=Chelonia mydas TaxID=8469 RepID=M7BX96_CHEMY|nr:Cytochrome P450 2H2 [Chelonia mydas]
MWLGRQDPAQEGCRAGWLWGLLCGKHRPQEPSPDSQQEATPFPVTEDLPASPGQEVEDLCPSTSSLARSLWDSSSTWDTGSSEADGCRYFVPGLTIHEAEDLWCWDWHQDSRLLGYRNTFRVGEVFGNFFSEGQRRFFIRTAVLAIHGSLLCVSLAGLLLAYSLLGKAQQLMGDTLSAKYGPIFTIYFGSVRVVVLYGYEIVKEALIGLGDEFSGRGSMPIFERISKGRGIVFSNGEQWKQLRRFALTNLRNFGMGKKSIEERIQEETHFLVERLRNTHGRPFDPTLFLTHAVSNVICSIIFGDRFDYEDKKFVTLISLVQENDKLQRSPWTALYVFFPTFMDYIPGPHQALFKNAQEFRRFVLERVKMHKESLDPNCPQDFIDAFLIKMKEEHKNVQSEFNVESLVRSTVELFIAGTGTTSITLKYGLLILLKYPEIEEKVHEEVDRVIGQSRSPCMADRSQMPYTDAVVHEIQRFFTFAPLGVPRAVTRDVHLKQYLIPKHDFQGMQGNEEKQRLIPQSTSVNFVGFSLLDRKRICVGEGLARMELFLLLTTILQNFTLKPVVDPKYIDITPKSSFMSNAPKSYQLCVLPR